MPRYAFRIEYNGSDFAGWQRQDHQKRTIPTVQATLEQAFQKLTQEIVVFHGAGRTDKGVHATGQMAHVNVIQNYDLNRLHRGLNFFLKNTSISIHKVWLVSDIFHARFSALWRRYRYHLSLAQGRPILNQQYCWWIPQKFCIHSMREALLNLVGHHDFSAFRSPDCSAISPFKTLSEVKVIRNASYASEIHLEFQAPSFLQQQVRRMVGAAVQVGRNRWSLDDFLRFKQKIHPLPIIDTAPPQGLVLIDVGYEEIIDK
jgi:tRNA pseudouridine38-40 synthase